MKMQEAMRIMGYAPKLPGFMVHFTRVNGCMLEGDYFPDVHAGEEPIQTEEQAWQMAAQFAAASWQRCVNIYVINRANFMPVADYAGRQIKNR